MTILSPDAIIARLEEDGKDAVEKKLTQGVYADYKLPLIKQWLKGQAEKAEVQEVVEEPVEENPEEDPQVTLDEDPPIDLTDEVVGGDTADEEKEPE